MKIDGELSKNLQKVLDKFFKKERTIDHFSFDEADSEFESLRLFYDIYLDEKQAVQSSDASGLSDRGKSYKIYFEVYYDKGKSFMLFGYDDTGWETKYIKFKINDISKIYDLLYSYLLEKVVEFDDIFGGDDYKRYGVSRGSF